MACQTKPDGDIILLTPDDIQSIFKIGKNKAYELMNSDGFPSFRVNSRLYVEQSVLLKWLSTYSGRKYSF